MICPELSCTTVAKERPVDPRFTVKSFLVIPLLKSSPVKTKVGFTAPNPIAEDVAIVLFPARPTTSK